LVYEIGPENRKEELLSLFEALTNGDSESGLVIDLAGVGVISPSVASAITAAAAQVIRDSKEPVLVTNARPEVIKSLEGCRHIRENPTPPIMVLDSAGTPTYIGAMPDRWRILLHSLPESGASASALAGPAGTKKREVNRYSVYLNELFMNGLARREKIPGSERDDAERGWTYVYHPVRPPRLLEGRVDTGTLDVRAEVA
jgi:hypothetical protein